MTTTNLGGMSWPNIGNAQDNGIPRIVGVGNVVISAAKAAIIMYGRVVTSDGASHTLNTTGSSSMGFRNAINTLANAGTTLKIGIAPVDAANGPPARAANTAGVIDFDVAAVIAGSGSNGGIASGAWNEVVPTTGSKTIANGDLVAFAIQYTALGGSDSLFGTVSGTPARLLGAGVTTFNGTATYSDQICYPNVVITFADGALGVITPCNIQNTITALTWNSGSTPKEYGNVMSFPVPVRITGISGMATITADCDFVIYTDPLGTPVAAKTVSVDMNTVSTATTGMVYLPLATPLDLAANTPIAVVMKPGASNVGTSYKSFNAAAHQAAEFLGSNCYAVNRSSGAFASQNSGKDRFALGVMLGGVDNGSAPAVPRSYGFA